MFPYTNQADLHTNGARVCSEMPHFDSDGYERTERRVGGVQCPQCGLWWPAIQEPDSWIDSPEPDGQKPAMSWWGGVVCDDCNLLMVDQPDGQTEVYQL